MSHSIQVNFNNAAVKLPSIVRVPNVVISKSGTTFNINIDPNLGDYTYLDLHVAYQQDITMTGEATVLYNDKLWLPLYLSVQKQPSKTGKIVLTGNYYSSLFKTSIGTITIYITDGTICSETTVCSEHTICSNL